MMAHVHIHPCILIRSDSHLGGVGLVVEEDDLEILDVVHGELVEARGKEEAGLDNNKIAAE